MPSDLLPTPAAPVLRHLNADTTWLLSIPVADIERGVFTLLIDPWFIGPQTDYWSYFSTQWHVVKSSVDHVSEIDHEIDAVVVSHEFTDHMHRKTLEEVDKDIPVYATNKAAAIIRTWSHFSKVYDIPTQSIHAHWSLFSVNDLPPSIGISRIASDAFDIAYYHSAICISYIPHSSSNTRGGEDISKEMTRSDAASAILYTPHGVPASALKDLKSRGITQVTALIHGLHEVWNPKILGGKLNLGAHNGMSSALQCNARWWIGTHDEVKKGRGIVSMVLRRKAWTLDDALERAESITQGKRPQFRALSSGEYVVLD